MGLKVLFITCNAGLQIRHFEKNSRAIKLKTQGKNSITQDKNSRIQQNWYIARKKCKCLCPKIPCFPVNPGQIHKKAYSLPLSQGLGLKTQ